MDGGDLRHLKGSEKQNRPRAVDSYRGGYRSGKDKIELMNNMTEGYVRMRTDWGGPEMREAISKLDDDGA